MRVLDAPFTLGLKLSRQIFTISTANLNRLIESHLENKCLAQARKLFDQNPTSLDKTTWNAMIRAHVEANRMQAAHELFDKMPERDTVSWNTMIEGISKIRDPQSVYQFFLEMQRSGIKPTEHASSSLISAVSETVFRDLIPQVHALTIHLGLNLTAHFGSALLKGYTSLKNQTALGRLFDDILIKKATEWDVFISCYMELGCVAEAKSAFDVMPEKDTVSWTIMVDGYITNKRVNEARFLFDQMSEKDVVCWTAMIKGYVQNGKYLAALELFREMMESGIRPNHYTISSVLGACAGCSSLLMGEQVHSSMVKHGIRSNLILSTSLLNMYAKSGDIEAAFGIFESIPRKSVEAWSSMIGGFARHGLGHRALQQLERMVERGFRPDEVTYVNVLSACAHDGLVEEGEMYFALMRKKGIPADKEHYACMVDMYGRAGQLDKAEKVIKEMPFEPDMVIWGALLAACGQHSCLKLGEFAAKGLSRLRGDHPAAYSILTKVHGEQGVWNSVVELRKMMQKNNIQKQRAGSWIDAPLMYRE